MEDLIVKAKGKSKKKWALVTTTRSETQTILRILFITMNVD